MHVVSVLQHIKPIFPISDFITVLEEKIPTLVNLGTSDSNAVNAWNSTSFNVHNWLLMNILTCKIKWIKLKNQLSYTTAYLDDHRGKDLAIPWEKSKGKNLIKHQYKLFLSQTKTMVPCNIVCKSIQKQSVVDITSVPLYYCATHSVLTMKTSENRWKHQMVCNLNRTPVGFPIYLKLKTNYVKVCQTRLSYHQ